MPLYAATRDLADAAQRALDEARVAHGEVVTYSTPRRMILVVEDLADASEALSMRAKGPAAAIAFDDDGKPTKAAEGFARGKGVDGPPSRARGGRERQGICVRLGRGALPQDGGYPARPACRPHCRHQLAQVAALGQRSCHLLASRALAHGPVWRRSRARRVCRSGCGPHLARQPPHGRSGASSSRMPPTCRPPTRR